MPTEKIRRNCRQREYGKNSDVENGFRLPAALNLSTACHDGVGLGGIKGEKERFVFERFFVGTERRKPLFALLLIYTAKNGKTWQKNRLFYKKFTEHIPQMAKKVYGRRKSACRMPDCSGLQLRATPNISKNWTNQKLYVVFVFFAPLFNSARLLPFFHARDIPFL